MFLIALIRYWRAMENEAITPAKPRADGGRLAADVLAAHAVASAGKEDKPFYFSHTHTSPTKKGRSKPPGTKRKDSVAGGPPPPAVPQAEDKAGAEFGSKYVIDVKESAPSPGDGGDGYPAADAEAGYGDSSAYDGSVPEQSTYDVNQQYYDVSGRSLLLPV